MKVKILTYNGTPTPEIEDMIFKEKCGKKEMKNLIFFKVKWLNQNNKNNPKN